MLIPSIDLMDGKIVQLVQGEKRSLEFTNFDDWIGRFSGFPIVQLIDLDAAIGTGDNAFLIRRFVERLPCQVGGGIRSITRAKEVLGLGAKRVIVGSSLIKENAVDIAFAQELSSAIEKDKLVFALDSRHGRIAIRGWRELTSLTASAAIGQLEPLCAAFLYTHIDGEGLMQGIPMDNVRELRTLTKNQLIVAGGITTRDEIALLHSLGIDAVVGMALYTGRLSLTEFTA